MSMGLPKRTALMLVDDREGHLGSGADIRRGSVDVVIATDADHAILAALAEHRSEADMLHEVELGEVGELLLAEPALHAEHPVTHRRRAQPSEQLEEERLVLGRHRANEDRAAIAKDGGLGVAAEVTGVHGSRREQGVRHESRSAGGPARACRG